MATFTYPTPPPASPSTQAALGVALALNVLLAAGTHMVLAFGHGTAGQEDIAQDILRAAPVIYLAFMLPVVGLYGMAAAAWTGWSWWRVPAATLAGATLALAANAWGMAWWIERQGWPVNPLLSASDGRIQHLLFLGCVSLLVMVGLAATLWPRWIRTSSPSVHANPRPVPVVNETATDR